MNGAEVNRFSGKEANHFPDQGRVAIRTPAASCQTARVSPSSPRSACLRHDHRRLASIRYDEDSAGPCTNEAPGESSMDARPVETVVVVVDLSRYSDICKQLEQQLGV